MIPFDRLIEEMERQLDVARRADDERAIREALTAIRSLCEVALGGGESKQEVESAPKLAIASNVQSIASLEGQPLEEEDANGNSLFDF